ncbi:MAG: BMP family ABC transporter substrate-binding protein [Firmicutes bacterium]|nr:BMP family ABC transporter substrate-binding protein [Bacillota bacterium]
MKKSISLLLVLALILSAFSLVGCGSEDGAEGEGLSVCLVVPTGFGDKSFNDSAKEGVDKLKADLGVNVSYIECKSESYKQQMMNAADTADIVIPVGWEFWEITEVAPEYPDTKFIWIDNVADGIENIPNLLCVTYAQNEGSFLAGYIAATMSNTGVVGAVGGADADVVNDFFVGYKQGAEYANPDVKFVKRYVPGEDGYENPAGGKECAQALHDEGADVIFQVAGNSGNGVFEAAQEGGFYVIGVDMDQKISASTFDDVIICSMVKKVGDSIFEAVRKYIEDESWEGGRVWVADMATGYIGIAYGDENSTQQVPDELKADVEDLSQKIVSGEIEVETTRQ